MIVEHLHKRDSMVYIKSTIHSKPMIVGIDNVVELIAGLSKALNEYNDTNKVTSTTIKMGTKRRTNK